MTFPDTIPAWLLNTPAIPDCPSWCLEPAGHHDPTHNPGDWTRFHVAFRRSFPTTVGEVTVDVMLHESWEGNVLRHEPAEVNVTNGEGMGLGTAARLLEAITAASAMLTTVSAGA